MSYCTLEEAWGSSFQNTNNNSVSVPSVSKKLAVPTNNLYNSDYLVSGIIFVTDENYLLLNFNNKVYQNNNQKVITNTNKSNRKFEMRITNLPDIFELYDENNKIGIASISTLELSELCNSLLHNKGSYKCPKINV